MATYTDNYNLVKPTMAETADIRTINGNMDVVDDIMHASQISLAPAYDSTETYNTGDVVMYEFLMYECLDDDVTGTWDSTKWQRTTAGEHGGGSDVSITPALATGTKIAEFEIDGVSGDLYAPNYSDKIGFIEDKVTQLQSFDVRDIFTLDNFVEGYYIQSANGIPSFNANTGHTDYIDVSSFADKITCALLASTLGNTYQGAFYDKDKVFISGIEKTNITTDIDFDFAIPLNAKYLRFSIYLDRKNDYYINATTKISKNSISDSDIFTTIGATLDHYCNGSNGAILQTVGVACTKYIDVSNFNFITTPNPNGQTHQGAFFDNEYNYISGYAQSGVGNITLSVPSNAKYIIVSYVMSLESSYYIKGTIPIDNIVNNVMNNPYTDRDYSAFKINCLGDSMTYGYTPDSGVQMKAPYPSQLQTILKASECRNYGISGSTLAVNSGNYDPMCTRYTDMDNDADIVMLFGGTNDYGRTVYTPTLGTISDAVNTTVYGALNILAEGLINKYPKAFIFFITPLRRADKTGDNAGGYSLEDVATAIKEVAYKYDIPVLDLYSKGGFHIENATFRSYYGGNDKLHPSQAFVTEHLAPMIARFIQSNI